MSPQRLNKIAIVVTLVAEKAEPLLFLNRDLGRVALAQVKVTFWWWPEPHRQTGDLFLTK